MCSSCEVANLVFGSSSLVSVVSIKMLVSRIGWNQRDWPGQNRNKLEQKPLAFFSFFLCFKHLSSMLFTSKSCY